MVDAMIISSDATRLFSAHLKNESQVLPPFQMVSYTPHFPLTPPTEQKKKKNKGYRISSPNKVAEVEDIILTFTNSPT